MAYIDTTNKGAAHPNAGKRAKMNKQIYVQCGIYDSQYKLVNHKDGTISVKAPFVKWVGDTGSLDHTWYRISPDDQNDVLAFFEADALFLNANNNGDGLSLQDVLDGNRRPGVHVIAG